jgi:xanthine dehydrogenase YagS FAD-binding subunit
MQAFQYKRADDVAGATSAVVPDSKFVAGGTTLIDLMKLNVETPKTLIDINRVPLDNIEKMRTAG